MTTTTEARISMGRLFKSLKYVPHAGQQKFHMSDSRHRVASCGRRFGKSKMGAAELDVEAVRTKLLLNQLIDKDIRREFWIVGPEYTDAEKEFRSHYNALKKAGAPFDRPGTYNDPHAGDMQISMYQGKYMVIGKSAQHQERLVGEGLSGVIMAEAAKQKESTWTKFIRPTLADYNGWAQFTTTPEGKNWLYDLYMRGQDPNDPSWASWRFGSWTNPHVYPKGATREGLLMLREAMDSKKAITPTLRELSGVDPEIIEFMLDLSEETFNQEIAADFTDFVGRVFKRFDDEYHVRDFDYNPALRTYAAVDYGFTNPFVWLLIQEDIYGNVYVVDEIYETGLSIDDAARLIDSRGLAPGGLITFYPDPASPSDTLALERHLKVKATGGTGGELNIRLRYIREALKDVNTHLPEGDPLRHPKLMINRKCTNMIREMNDYRYPTTSKESNRNPKDEPLKKDDHTPEALGRYYRGRYGDPGASAEASGGARVARSNMSGSGGVRRRRTRRSEM
jgi:hypothetical protein